MPESIDTVASSSPGQVSRAPLAPFNNAAADLIIRSSNEVDFRVRKAILAEASVVFADMFAICDSTTTDIPTVPVTESSGVLDALLRICYPVQDPEMSSAEEVLPLVEVACKYQMDYPLIVLKRRLLQFADSSPVVVYAVGIQFELADVTTMAARRFLRQKAPWAYTPELDRISGGAYHRLIEYRERCCSAATAALCEQFQWLSPGALSYPWFHCRTSPCHGDYSRKFAVSGSIRSASTWFISFVNHCSNILRASPCREALLDDGVTDNVLMSAAACTKCRSDATCIQIRAFIAELCAEVDKRVSEVVLVTPV